MDQRDRDSINNRYNTRLALYGPGSKALATGSDARRDMRYQILKEVGISSGDRVLDVGCGFGDLFAYFAKCQLDVHYFGIDINPNIVQQARLRFPEASFDVGEVDDVRDVFDYVVSTETFNLRLQAIDNYEYVSHVLERCHQLAVKGVAVDFLTSYVDFRGNPEEAFYYDPGRVFEISKRITKRVSLRHDYPLFEFCVYLYPDFTGWATS